MFPVLEGIIRRRILLNFRADPGLVRPLVPEPLEVTEQNGHAIVGVCLIGLEQVRPKGLPAAWGLSTENMAHRVAVRYSHGGIRQDGVFIFRRDTNQRLISTFGGALFPGVHGHAEFEISEHPGGITFDATTSGGEADVSVKVSDRPDWIPTPAFRTLAEVSEFFRRGSCGFSCAKGGNLEQMELKTLEWNMTPLEVHSCRAPFYQSRWPVELDGALIMRRLAHEWHARSIATSG